MDFDKYIKRVVMGIVGMVFCVCLCITGYVVIRLAIEALALLGG